MSTFLWCSVVLLAVLAARGAHAQAPSNAITGITGTTTVPMHREWSFTASGTASFETNSGTADNQLALMNDASCPSVFASLAPDTLSVGVNSGFYDVAPMARGSRGEAYTLVLGANAGSDGFRIIDASGGDLGVHHNTVGMHYGRFMNANGDHLHDVVGCAGSSCHIVTATSPTSFPGAPLTVSFSGAVVNQVAVADFNGDGVDDIVLPLNEPSVAVAVSNDPSTPGSYTIVPLNTCAEPVVGVLDVDKDGDLDVVATCSGGKLTWWENQYKEDGTFAGGVVLSDPVTPSREVRSLAIADVTNDGLLDVVVSTTNPIALVVYTNSGTGDSWANTKHYEFTGTSSHSTVAVVRLMGTRPYVIVGCGDCDAQGEGMWRFEWDHFTDTLKSTPLFESVTSLGEYMLTTPETRKTPERVAVMSGTSLMFYGIEYAPISHGIAFSSTITMSPVWRDVAPEASLSGTMRLCYNNGGGWSMQSDPAVMNFVVSNVESLLSDVSAATVVDSALADATTDTRWSLSRDGEANAWASSDIPTGVTSGSENHVLASMGAASILIDMSATENTACSGSSSGVSISPSGRYIAYVSTCKDIAGATATGDNQRVFLYDHDTGQTMVLHADGCGSIRTTVVADNGVVAWLAQNCAASSHDCPGEPAGDHPYLWDGASVKHLACDAVAASVPLSYEYVLALSSSGNALAVTFANYRPISMAEYTVNTPDIAEPMVFLWDVAAQSWTVGSAVAANEVLPSRYPALTAHGGYLSYVTGTDYAHFDTDLTESLYLRDLASYETEWCGMRDGVSDSIGSQLGRVTEDGSACVWTQNYAALGSAASRYKAVAPAGHAVYRRFTSHYARENLGGVERVDWLSARMDSSPTNTPVVAGITGLSGDGRVLMLSGGDWVSFLTPFTDAGASGDFNMGLFMSEYSPSLVAGAYSPSTVTVGESVTLAGLPTPYWHTDAGVFVAWAAPEDIHGIYCGRVEGETQFYQSGDSIALGGSFSTEGTRILCASHDGVTYYAQHSASSLLVQRAATATEVTGISPESWEVDATPSLSLTLDKDFPLAATTSIAFAVSDCGTRVGQTVVQTNPVTLDAGIASADTYKVCVSLDDGNAWTMQEMAGVVVTAAAAAAGGASGDPHFLGMHGGYYDFAGEPGRVFNLLSDTHMQVNALFVRNEDGLPGNYMAEIGVALGNRTRIAFRRDGRVSIHPLHRAPGHTPNRALLEGGGVAEWTDTELVVLWDVYRLQLNKYGWARDMTRTDASHLGYRLWVDEHKLREQGRMETFAPHGVHGVSWRAWSVAVPTGVQGEGIIEGVWEDYALASGDLFGSDFTFNQYAEQPCGDDIGVPAGEHLSAGPIRAV